jgi:hypothetical protein
VSFSGFLARGGISLGALIPSMGLGGAATITPVPPVEPVEGVLFCAKFIHSTDSDQPLVKNLFIHRPK